MILATTLILDSESRGNHIYVNFEVFTVVTMKNAVFWDI
jgi:hypothetical protein